MSEAVLFLDIDGVLNDESVFRDKRFGPFPINHESVMRLHDVIRQTGAKIVLSSSWREMPRLERKLEAEFVFEAYIDMTATQVRHEDGSTKRLSGDEYKCRGSEIAEWLARHPEVTRYAIVDDESDMLDDQKPFFVKTSFETGLDDQAASALAAILVPPPQRSA